ncbi:MAG: hypothetical protein ACRDT4_09475 [Micromonosporaceae bacterium]
MPDDPLRTSAALPAVAAGQRGLDWALLVRDACGPYHDEPTLRLALLGGLVEMGWNKALWGRRRGDAGPKPAARTPAPLVARTTG